MTTFKRKTVLDQKAFTIIELMIATAVLSIILVLVTAMMIGIGNLYYKGSTQSSVQDNVRNITDEISQDLQLNGSALLTDGGTNPNLPRAYCIGNTRYTYILGKQISTQSTHVLWRDTVTAGICTPATLGAANPSAGTGGSNGTEMIGPNSMLTKFTISTGSSPFTIGVGEAFGTSDLLCDGGTAADCTAITNSTHIWNPNPPVGNVLCKGLAGSQFCSTDYLTTTVSERLQ